MKVLALLLTAAAAITPTIVDASCVLCPNGISLNENATTLVPDLTDVSELMAECESAVETYTSFDDGTDLCTQGKMGFVPLCCPAVPDDPCTICGDGIKVEGEEDVASCESIILSNANFEEGSKMCELAKSQSEPFCCGSNGPILFTPTDPTVGGDFFIPTPEPEPIISEPCALCPDGVTATDEETVAACNENSDSFARFPADDEFFCSGITFRELQSICCPDSLTPMANPCTICPDGVKIDENNPNNEWFFGDIGNETDIAAECEEVITSYSFYDADADFCPKDTYESVCCPTPVENPCTICPVGIKLDEINPNIFLFGNDNGTDPLAETIAECEEAIASSAYYATFEADSYLCPKSTYEAMCCPTPLENPCTICPDGIKLDENSPNVFFGSLFGDDNGTDPLAETMAECEEIVASSAFYAAYEADSEFCPKSTYETMCCPTLPNNPCTICPDGVSATFFADEDECNGIVTAYSFYSADDEFYCSADTVQNYKNLCCPTPLENPCLLCPGGINVEEGPYINFLNETELAEQVASCEISIEYAKQLEADSEDCKGALMSEVACCPAPVEDPCTLCAGVAVNADVTIPELGTCSDMIKYASFVSAVSEDCGYTQIYEVLCCPTPATTPCSICAEGYEIDEEAIFDDDLFAVIGLTCSETASYIEEDSVSCPLAKEELNSTCCVPVGAEVIMPGEEQPIQDSGNVTVNQVGNMTSASPVASPVSGNMTSSPVMSPVNMADDGASNMTSSPVASPANDTNITAVNATSSPVASPVDETSLPSPKPTSPPTTGPISGTTPVDPIDGQPNSAGTMTTVSQLHLMVTVTLLAWDRCFG